MKENGKMAGDLLKDTAQKPQNARRDLTNGPRYYTLLLTGNNKANRAECWSTPHGSNPTLTDPVTGLRRIIQNHGTPVLCGFGGPTDSFVGLGRFAVLGPERV
jgi:hypothetical protein